MSVVVYDLETSGVDPASDRIVQFAGVRATDDLTEIIETENFLVALDPEVVPDPVALMVGELTPQRLCSEGMPEHEAVDRIAKFLGERHTTRTGYNTIDFDDVFVRYAMWRNLHDPYRTEWDNGNQRVDAQTLFRAASVLTPSLLTEWPVKDDGSPSYRLGALVAAAGLDFDGRAHDALSDSKATLDLLRLLRKNASRIWDVGLQCADKLHVSETVHQTSPAHVLMHVSPFYGNARRCCAPVALVGKHPTIGNRSIHVDLASDVDPQMLCDLSAEQIRERLFASADEKEGVERPPLHTIAHNAAPFVIDLSASEERKPGALDRFVERTTPDGPAATEIVKRAAYVRHYAREIASKMAVVFAAPEREEQDAELALYGGFLSKEDVDSRDNFREAVAHGDWEEAGILLANMEDSRLVTLARRYWGRCTVDQDNAPDDIALDYANHVVECRSKGFGSRKSLAEYAEAAASLSQEEHDRPDLVAELVGWPTTPRTPEREGMGR